MATIIPRIVGGTGNQLFIYAAARRLALVNGAELVLDDVSGFVRDFIYQRHYQLDHFSIPCRKATASERFEPWSRPRRALKRWWNRRKQFAERQYLCQEGPDFDPRLLILRPQGRLYLEGYWISEGYFKDVAQIIRKDLIITPPSDEMNLSMAATIQQQRAVAVHVRFFDEPYSSGRQNTSSQYYRRAIDVMETQVSNAHYYLFSDRPDAARAIIPLPEEKVTPVKHNQGDAMAFADLWLMTHCQHYIIANSTFSWWGAWLSRNHDKHVLYPSPSEMDPSHWWRGKGLLPDDWTPI